MKYSECKEYLKEGMKCRLLVCDDSCQGEVQLFKRITEAGNIGFDHHLELVNLGSNELELEILTEADGVTPWKDPRVSETPKFKVGDRVICVNKIKEGEVDYGSGWELGKVFTIEEISDFERPILWPKPTGHGIYSDCVELLPEKKPKFKVGDKVRDSIGRIDTVKLIPGMYEYDMRDYVKSDQGFVLENQDWDFQKDWELLPAEELKVYKDEFSYQHSPWYGNPTLSCIEWAREYYLKKPRLFKRKESKMNSIIKSIQAKLNPVDRTLVKHGYLNSNGTRTGMYEDQLREMAIEKLIVAEDTEEFRKELATELEKNNEK